MVETKEEAKAPKLVADNCLECGKAHKYMDDPDIVNDPRVVPYYFMRDPITKDYHTHFIEAYASYPGTWIKYTQRALVERFVSEASIAATSSWIKVLWPCNYLMHELVYRTR